MPSFHRSSFRVPRSPRASVLILVVAVLALLVLMGTAYLVSARTDRANATSMSAANNIELARDGAMGTIVQTIGSSILDSAGKIGGYDATTATYKNNTGAGFVAQASRNYDYPEIGAIFGQSSVATVPDQPWLVSKLHNPASGTDMGKLTPALFDPSTGVYDIGYASANTVNVVHDQSTATDAEDPVTTTYDAYLNLLPFSDASGIRYRFAQRILDTNRMANLNTGSPSDTGSVADYNGNYITSIRLAPDPATAYPAANTSPPGPYPASGSTNYFDSADNANAANLQSTSANLGRVQSTSPYATFTGIGAVQQWQSLMFQIENPPPAGMFSMFDLSDELELRSYGQYGTLYTPRPAMNGAAGTTIWPNTLGNRVPPTSASLTGNPRRRNFTAYSFSQELRTQPNPPTAQRFICTPSSGTVMPTIAGTAGWPTAPAKVSVNQDLGIANPASAMGQLAATAANIATAMYVAGGTPTTNFPAYTSDELSAFIANYITGRWNGFKVDPNITTATAYTLPAGPSFLQGNNIYLRTADTAGNPITGDFAVAGPVPLAASKIVLGYAAQPFISKFYCMMTSDGTAATVVDFAVELYNPYGVALSLQGWHLKIDGGYDKSLDTFYIPAQSSFIITMGSNFNIDPSAQSTNDTNFNPAGHTRAILYRPYCPPGATSLVTGGPLAAVDLGDFSAVIDTATLGTNIQAGTNVTFIAARSGGSWGFAANSFQPPAQFTGTTLGTQGGGTGNPGYVLYDRLTVTPTYTGVSAAQPQGTPFANIADFEKLMRIANEVDTTGQPLTPSLLITDQVYNAKTAEASPPWSNMDLKGEAILHFDFKAVPQSYASSPPSDATAPTAPLAPGDIRAVRVLDQIAFLDRASDLSTTGSTDVTKIRLPGQINVNTASGDVLRAIPNMSDQMVANILSYRARSNTIGYNTATGASRYGTAVTDYSTYPALGIRSLSELMIPTNNAGTTAPMNNMTTINMTIPERDKLWASVYNLCTVRSDTFVVYGYLEALKTNPAVTHNNGTDWYGAATDDPHDLTIKNIRVGKRRWVAIVDRSFCNYDRTSSNFAVPRVVAIKDLPQ